MVSKKHSVHLGLPVEWHATAGQWCLVRQAVWHVLSVAARTSADASFVSAAVLTLPASGACKASQQQVDQLAA